MPKIERRVTPEMKAKWRDFCKSKGVSESEMLGMMIERVTSGAVDLQEKGITQGGLSDVQKSQMNIKLPASALAAISARAKSEGFTSRTTWAVQVLSQALTAKPVLTEQEINTIRASNRELSAVGRNLNQIARQLNIEFRDSDRLNLEAIEKLGEIIEQHKSLVAAFLDKSQKRWE